MARIDPNAPRPLTQTNSTSATSNAAPAAPAAQPQAPAPVNGGWTQTATTAKQPALVPQAAAPATDGAQQKQAVVCPVLASLIASGAVKEDAQGNISLKDITAALGNDDVSKTLQTMLHPIGWSANNLKDLPGNISGDKFNVEDLRSGALKHPGDSAILTAGQFDESKFQALVSHADNGVMTEKSFGEAIADNTIRDAKQGQISNGPILGKPASQIEFGALLAAFGTRQPNGQMGISVNDLRNLYQNKQLPPNHPGAGLVNTSAVVASLEVKSDARLAGRALDSVATFTGLASKGADLTENRAKNAAGAQASNSAGKAANCPFLSGGIKPPGDGAQTVNAHTQAGMGGS